MPVRSSLSPLLALVTVTLLMLVAPCVRAVDGYAGIAFGTDQKTFLAKRLCNFQPRKSDVNGVDYLGCDDLAFAGEKVEAGAFFINGKFLRFSIVTPLAQSFLIAEGLTQKYGKPSSQSSAEAFEQLSHDDDAQAYLAFDHDTVFYKFSARAARKKQVLLIYTSPRYEQLLKEKQLLLLKQSL
ncbi:hypothetical protein [Pseudomonas sp. EpS/L25]|uniref:hypothetical protein n=1 Tax=Pseudomonas sp. EpS/L25 TaxID=1749078 RepID=UPI000744519A|nr:hypothetical protein [Pseudomonas sp. EpS/L25]KUM41879.1 hypothetical protein AR540_06545 [Pseudomonas sp. EpS/L25]